MEEPKPRSPRAGGTVPTQPRGIEQIIKAAVDRGASDLHIKAGVVLRVIPFDVPSFDSLKLPPVLTTVAAAERGMILVTGVTGSGKSSTMAAIINHINQTQNKHVVTLENPIEFLHRDISCSVTQREIGVDTDDFRMGLLAALEVMICTGTARDMIKDPNRAGELHDYIRDAREQYGMQTFDQHLMDLVAEGVVAYETALAAASNPADFELQMRTLRRRPRVGPPAGAVEKPAGFSDDLSSLLPPS